MLLVWRGWGIGVPLIVILMQLLTEKLVDNIAGTPEFIKMHSWIWLIGLSVSAVLIWFIGKFLDSKPGRIVLDKETQREYELKSRHDFFWLPFKWWAIPVFVLGFIFTFV